MKKSLTALYLMMCASTFVFAQEVTSSFELAQVSALEAVALERPSEQWQQTGSRMMEPGELIKCRVLDDQTVEVITYPMRGPGMSPSGTLKLNQVHFLNNLDIQEQRALIEEILIEQSEFNYKTTALWESGFNKSSGYWDNELDSLIGYELHSQRDIHTTQRYAPIIGFTADYLCLRWDDALALTLFETNCLEGDAEDELLSQSLAEMYLCYEDEMFALMDGTPNPRDRKFLFNLLYDGMSNHCFREDDTNCDGHLKRLEEVLN